MGSASTKRARDLSPLVLLLQVYSVASGSTPTRTEERGEVVTELALGEIALLHHRKHRQTTTCLGIRLPFCFLGCLLCGRLWCGRGGTTVGSMCRDIRWLPISRREKQYKFHLHRDPTIYISGVKSPAHSPKEIRNSPGSGSPYRVYHTCLL